MHSVPNSLGKVEPEMVDEEPTLVSPYLPLATGSGLASVCFWTVTIELDSL